MLSMVRGTNRTRMDIPIPMRTLRTAPVTGRVAFTKTSLSAMSLQAVPVFLVLVACTISRPQVHLPLHSLTVAVITH